MRYAYDGMDFISFEKETLTWVATQPQLQEKEEWEDDPIWSKKMKVFLEETCIEWLQRYLSYRNKTLQRIGEWQRGSPLSMFLCAPPSPYCFSPKQPSHLLKYWRKKVRKYTTSHYRRKIIFSTPLQKITTLKKSKLSKKFMPKVSFYFPRKVLQSRRK